MANFMYDHGLQAIGDGTVDLLTDNIKACLCTAAYTANQSADQFLSSVSGIVSTSGNLSSKTISAGGVFDAADITFSAVSGAQVTQMLVYKDSGSTATSVLLARYDTGAGLPFTPSGANMPVQWDNGANKIFRI